MSFPIVHNANSPCPVCGRKSGKCKQTGDGLLICREPGIFEGDERNGFVYGGACKNDAFHKWFALDRDGGTRRGRYDYVPHEPTTPKPPKREVPEFPGVYSGRLGGAYVFDYDEIVRKARAMKPAQQEAMAKELGLPPWAHLCMPWQFTFDREGQPCWTTPEYGLVGDQVVIISRHLRYTPDARPSGKRTYGNPHLPEGTPRRGVFIPTGWHDEPGPLLATEGASGSWAARVMGCCSLGRPACGAGGTDTIAHLYRQHFADQAREVWVVADNDENLAGEKGGRKAAVNLANLLSRPVSLVRLAGGIKDTRDWFIRYSPHFDLDTLRDKYFESLELVEVVQPGEKNEPARVDAKTVLVAAAIAGIYQTDYTKLIPDATPEQIAEREEREKARQASEANTDASRYSLPPLPACHHTISLRHKSENKGRVVAVSCGRWACPDCNPHLKNEWKTHMRTVFATLTGVVYAQNYTEENWPRIYRQIQRQGGRYVKVIDGDTYLIIATAPFAGTMTITPAQALEHLLHAIDCIPYCRKPISTCKEWRKPEGEESGEWKRDAQLPWNSTLAHCSEILRGAGIEPTLKVPAGHEHKRRYLDFEFPEEFDQREIDNVFASLYVGEWIPLADLTFASVGAPADPFDGLWT